MSRWVTAIAVVLSLNAVLGSAAPPPAATPAVDQRAAVQAWLRERAIALDTVESGHGFDDMQPLKAIVGNARIVALGEATHGTREFFQVKHRMLEFLVREMGFTAFAMEVSAPDTVPVNDYVLYGKGKAADVVAGMGFWTLNTEEVVEMVEWMRSYNADPRHAKKVQFFGFDMQSPPAAVKSLGRYLEKVDPAAAKGITESLAPLAVSGIVSITKTSVQAKLRTALEELETLLAANRERYLQTASESEWAAAVHDVDLLRQGARFREASSDRRSGVRDASMAENVQWILKSQPEGTRIVLWAHNRHVGVGTQPRTLGSYLREMYKDELRIFGFAFGQGSFRAADARTHLLRTFMVSGPAAGSFDGALARSGIPLFAIDLRTASGAAAQWLAQPLEHRSVGGTYIEEPISRFWSKLRMAEQFDAIFFVAKTTAARGINFTRK